VTVGEATFSTKDPSLFEQHPGMGTVVLDPLPASTQLDGSPVGGFATCVDFQRADVKVDDLEQYPQQPRAISRGDSMSSRRVASLWRYVGIVSKKLRSKPEALDSVSYDGALSDTPEFEEAPQRRESSSFSTMSVVDTNQLTNEQRDKHDQWMRAYGDISLWSVAENTDGWEQVAWTEVDEAEDSVGVDIEEGVEGLETPVPDDCRPQCPLIGVWPRDQQGAIFERLDECCSWNIDGEDAAPLSIGCRSAPAVCYAFREGFDDDLDLGWCSQSEDTSQIDSWSEESEDVQSDSSSSVFVKEHSTILDVLEAVGELKRQRVVDKIGRARRELQRIRRSVRASKLEFELLKTGMYTVTPEVAWLRQRWGVKRRVKNRERLARAKEREEEYLWFDIPLMGPPLTSCRKEATAKLACMAEKEVALVAA